MSRQSPSSPNSLVKRAVKKELNTRTKKTDSDIIAKLLKVLAPKQLAFVQDPSRFKIARAGRRGGKSIADIVMMLVACLQHPNSPVLYLGLTRDSAKDAIWTPMLMILDHFQIPYEAQESKLRLVFPNGSFIKLFGADTPNAKNRLRGQKFRLVVVDECGFVAQVDELVYALLPMLADYGGTLALTSSPGVVLAGLFYEADVGAKVGDWSQHHWTMHDNPHFQKPALDPKYKNRAEEEFEIIVNQQFGGNWNHPAFRREYLGEWVQDGTSLVYPYDNKNLIDGPSKLLEPMYGFGIDLGSVSANAIVIVRYSMYHREVEIVDAWKQPNLLVDELAQKLEEFIDIYQPNIIVADTGGYGSGIVRELNSRYQLGIQAAEKTDKAFHQRIFANDLISRYIKVVKGLPILLEWAKITKDEEGTELPKQENHLADAALYIYRRIYSTVLKSFEPPKSEEEKMIERIESKAKRERDEFEEDYGVYY